MRKKKKEDARLKVSHERGTNWITVKGEAWKRAGYPEGCIDRFGDVWLKPWLDGANLYSTVEGDPVMFYEEDGYLKEN